MARFFQAEISVIPPSKNNRKFSVRTSRNYVMVQMDAIVTKKIENNKFAKFKFPVNFCAYEQL